MKRLGITVALCAGLSVATLTGCVSQESATADTPQQSSAAVSTIQSDAQTAKQDLSASSVDPESNAKATGKQNSDETSSDAAASNKSGIGEGSSLATVSGEAATPSDKSDSDAAAVSSETAPSSSATSSSTAGSSSAALPDLSNLFTERDLQQEADTASAKSIQVSDGEDVSITEEGIYVLSGSASNATVTVSADDSAKVQLVLDGLNISNDTKPAIYVASADKVFLTTAAGSNNALSVSGTFATSTDANIDGVIFAKDDLVLNGTGTLSITSSANGIVGKDDVKVTGGTYQVKAEGHAIQGKDSVAIADGTFELTATKDGIHAENSDDQTLGYAYIQSGTFTINSESDGVEGDAFVVIDGGTFNIDSAEGIEGTYVQVNDGTITIKASDDGINATTKSTAYSAKIEINGGNLNIAMGSGDTDALDSNGDLIINGGTINITAQSPFDYDGQGQLNGGAITVNGEQVSELANSMMGGPGMGGQGGMGRPDGQGNMGGQDGMGRPDGQGNMGGQGGMDGHDRGHHGPRSQGERPDGMANPNGTTDSGSASSPNSTMNPDNATSADGQSAEAQSANVQA